MIKTKIVIIPLIALVWLASTLINSQPDPTTLEDILEAETSDIACGITDLTAYQSDLNDLFETFSDDLQDDEESALAQLYLVGEAYQKIALACGYIPDDVGTLTVGTDLGFILRGLEEVRGDPLMGQLLYNGIENAANGSPLSCSGCHINAQIAPLTEGTWTRWDEVHSLETRFEDYTFEQYIVESTIHPGAYIVEGYPEGTMPANFGDILSFQNLADIIAYLDSQDQELDE